MHREGRSLGRPSCWSRAGEISKDRLLTGNGILMVERIAAEDTDDVMEIDLAIHNLLRMLAQIVVIDS